MKRLLILTFLFAGSRAFLFSQNNSFNSPPVHILSPEAANLGKFGAYNVNHYSGAPGINVPIYQLTEAGLSIPISLGYDASGFIPNKNAGVAGQNWNLTAGGAVTRVVKGVPDEKYDHISSTLYDLYTKEHKGYIYGINELAPNSLPSQSHIEDLQFLGSSHNNQIGFPMANLNSEYNPDIFSFNFLGHSGTFVMGNDGQVKVNSDRKYKVDLSAFITNYNKYDLGASIGNLAFQQTLQNTPNLNTASISKIVITSDDGYVFHFGGLLSALEVSFSYVAPAQFNRHVDGKTGVVNSWYLTKAVAPDGEEVNFDYGIYSYSDAEVLTHLTDINTGWWDSQRQVEFMDIKLYLKNSHEAWHLFGSTSSSDYPPIDVEKSLIKMAYLKKIETKLRTVNFTYSRRNEFNSNYFYTTQAGGTDFASMINKNQGYFSSKLERITIQDKAGISSPIDDGEFLGSPRLVYDFVYQFYGSMAQGNRLFLKELKFNNNSTKYVFDYWRTGELQHPLTAAIDKWGYYNAEAANVRLVGLFGPIYGDPLEFESNFTYTGQVRTANPVVSDIGLLHTITYPTGGKTDFEYEGHKVKKILKRLVNTQGNSMIPTWVELTSEENVGGARIKKIINTPGTTTEFKYIKNYNSNPSGPSSGLLTEYGVFRMRYNKGNGDYHDQLFDQNISKAAGYAETPVCYPQVVEITGNGTEGFSKYIFTNPDNGEYENTPAACPDLHFISNSAIKYWDTDYDIISLANQMKRISRPSSRATERGKLWKKEVYAQGGTTPLMSQEYIYNQDPNRFTEKTVGYERIYNKIYPDNTALAAIAYFFNSFHLYHYHNNPSQIIEKNYANGQVNTTTTSFTYKGNSNPLLTEKTITKSDGSVFRSQFFYPEDKVGDPEYPFSSGMVSKNILSTVLEERTFIGTTAIATKKYYYSDITGAGGYKPVSTKTINHTIAGAGAEEGMNISYYGDGNVKEVFKSNDTKTAYLWDYKGVFPIAEVKNAGSATDIAYTSFETNETWSQGGYNQWSYNINARTGLNPCPTGSSVFDLNYGGNAQTITRTLNPANEYVLSIWFFGSSINVNGLTPVNGATIGNWVYKEYSISGSSSVSITGTGKVDELRLYPKGAFMTTYAYQPLFGIMNQCDVNNRISYYSYDNAARLTLIRDKDFNILKKICYKYNYLNGPQPVSCSNVFFKSGFLTQNFTKNDCGAGYEGSVVAYTVPANAFGSMISQADADQQAQSDLAFNGQAFANANGICICTETACPGPDKKCINGICETGIWSVIASQKMSKNGPWECTYAYCFSDGTMSSYRETITSSTACAITCY
ncbi:MAG: hypothetical protein JNK27_01280 [Chitinophagaceae bacterium]|nr:hypothetical protein [Chitinophagaceae bacterium]